jgi:ribosome maturation factor RimP
MSEMKLEEIRERVMKIIEPVIDSLGIELDDVELGKMRGKALLRVTIDKDGGVSIDDCERVSREIEALLDVEDPIPYSYTLEVSSPGLDRPLRKPGDFTRFSGHKVRIVTHEPVGKQTFFVGEILKAGNSDVELSLSKNKKVVIPYNNISRARLEVEV